MPEPVVTVSSAIERVVVHARGALVTRSAILPEDLAGGSVDVELPGVTLLADAGSARARLEDSERAVAAVHAALVVPDERATSGPTLARVRELGARVQRLDDELRVLSERRRRVVELALSPEVRAFDGKRPRDALDTRFTEALRVATLLRDKTAALDERLLALEAEHREATRALEAARLEDVQASSRERMGAGHPTRTVTARLVGSGRPGRLLVTYAVPAARWWPSYTLRLEDGGRRARWIFEALVAQRTGEDWLGVPVSLSSGDLLFDASLPELPSLRFGRAQPPRRRAYRAPPVGVDAMFSGYLAFAGRGGKPVSESQTVRPPPPPPVVPPPQVLPTMRAMEAAPISVDAVLDEDEDTAVNLMALPGTGVPPPAPGRGGAPLPPQAPRRTRPPPAPAIARARAELAYGGGPPGGAARDEPAEPPEPEIVPSEAWTDFDALVLASADDPRRGRLVRRVDPGTAGAAASAARSVDEAADARLRDPLATRGVFDHRYEAQGLGDVPSDGRLHRVAVGAVDCSARLSWRTVPAEDPSVYREAHLTNPFETALLGGPVEVYLDGSLLASTAVDRVDRGGSFVCGLGVDDRIKVARNVRAEEESAGLLGGSTAVTHSVGIELSSTIKDPVEVTVLERVPVSDDRAVEIKVTSARPEPEVYDQADRGSPVRGGRRFHVTVRPDKKTSIELVYRLVFSSKLDIVGGSRRG